MQTRITVMNFKGGQGKSTVAFNLSKYLDLGIVANETYTVLRQSLSDEELLIIRDKIPPELEECIFDFGGGITPLMKEAVESSRLTIVPFVPEYANVLVTVDCLNSIKDLTENILLIANQVRPDSSDLQAAKDSFLEFGFEYPMLSLRNSTAMQHCFRENRSVSDMADDKVRSFAYRNIKNDMEQLVSTVREYL